MLRVAHIPRVDRIKFLQRTKLLIADHAYQGAIKRFVLAAVGRQHLVDGDATQANHGDADPFVPRISRRFGLLRLLGLVEDRREADPVLFPGCGVQRRRGQGGHGADIAQKIAARRLLLIHEYSFHVRGADPPMRFGMVALVCRAENSSCTCRTEALAPRRRPERTDSAWRPAISLQPSSNTTPPRYFSGQAGNLFFHLLQTNLLGDFGRIAVEVEPHARITRRYCLNSLPLVLCPSFDRTRQRQSLRVAAMLSRYHVEHHARLNVPGDLSAGAFAWSGLAKTC